MSVVVHWFRYENGDWFACVGTDRLGPWKKLFGFTAIYC